MVIQAALYTEALMAVVRITIAIAYLPTYLPMYPTRTSHDKRTESKHRPAIHNPQSTIHNPQWKWNRNKEGSEGQWKTSELAINH